MDWLKYLIIPLALSALITPFLKIVAYRLDIYAQVNERTVHKGKIARIGGVAIYISFVVCMAVFMKTDMTINGILIGGTIMFIGGLIDDMVNLKPKYKLAFEVAAAIVLMTVGKVSLDVIRLPMGISIDMGLVSFIVTFVWIIGITNAVNLIDGLDGLAGATMGFLLYNSHPASIFMGDCGALFLGFIISAISLLGFKSSTIMTLALPILLLAVPIVDTIGAILRRKLSGHKFSEADKNHLHHLLMQRFGHRNTVIILYVVTALFGFTAYIYLINKATGFLVLFIIALVVELFIEFSGMISKQYHPLLSIANTIQKRARKLYRKFSKKSPDTKQEK